MLEWVTIINVNQEAILLDLITINAEKLRVSLLGCAMMS